MAKDKAAKPAKAASAKIPINWRNVLLTAMACLLLLVANSALWANKVFFNTDNFTEITTQAVQSQPSREAIAREIVDISLENRPAAKRVVSATATKLIAGLLDTNLATSAVDKSIALLQTALTSAKPQPITVQLGGVKATLQQLIEITNRDQAEARLGAVPDDITLLDTNKLPDFYQAGRTLLLLGPISAVIALAMLAFPHLRARNYEYSSKLLLLQGPMIILTGLLALAIGPIFRPTILAQVNSFNLRIVVQNIYNSFISTFNAQSAWLIWLGILMVVVPAIVALYNSTSANDIKQKLKK